jgi:hypothetical protein
MMYRSRDIAIAGLYYSCVRSIGGVYDVRISTIGGVYDVRISTIGGGRMYNNVLGSIGMYRSRDITIAGLYYSGIRSVGWM